MTMQHEHPVQVETPVAVVRRHGSVLVLPVALLVVLAGVSGFFVGALSEPWMNIAAGIAALVLALLLGIAPILLWLANRITVTNRRVIVRTGLFVQHRIEVPLSKVREVRLKRGPFQRACGSGDLRLFVGENITVLRDVPGPILLLDALHDLIETNYRASQATQQQFGFGQPGAEQTQQMTYLAGAVTGAGAGASSAAPAFGFTTPAAFTNTIGANPSDSAQDQTTVLPR